MTRGRQAVMTPSSRRGLPPQACLFSAFVETWAFSLSSLMLIPACCPNHHSKHTHTLPAGPQITSPPFCSQMSSAEIFFQLPPPFALPFKEEKLGLFQVPLASREVRVLNYEQSMDLWIRNICYLVFPYSVENWSKESTYLSQAFSPQVFSFGHFPYLSWHLDKKQWKCFSSKVPCMGFKLGPKAVACQKTGEEIPLQSHLLFGREGLNLTSPNCNASSWESSAPDIVPQVRQKSGNLQNCCLDPQLQCRGQILSPVLSRSGLIRLQPVALVLIPPPHEQSLPFHRESFFSQHWLCRDCTPATHFRFCCPNMLCAQISGQMWLTGAQFRVDWRHGKQDPHQNRMLRSW